MFCTIINDCRDANAAGRQITRVTSLLSCPTNLIGVQNDLESAGNLVDVLDAAEGGRGVVLVNVAPRNGMGKKWQNGTPFGYFWHKETLVLASVDGYTLSLAKKLGVMQNFRILETPAEYAKSQFRSFEFLPRAAKALLSGEKLAENEFDISEIPEAPKAVWWVDNFGNCKTTVLLEEINLEVGQAVGIKFGKLICFESLKDVSDGEVGLVIGSSGLADRRFLEIMKQGSSAAEELNISSGDVVIY
jgi:hypothetical protein